MTSEASATGASGGGRRVRPWLDFVFAFVCIFGGLSLPLPGLGPLFVRAHAALGNALLPRTLASGVELSFRANDELLRAQPWTLTLFVQPPSPASVINVPIDLRTLLYLPLACFVALALATPSGWPRRSLAVMGVGLALLEPLLVGLLALPLLSFLGGTGPVRAFTLGLGTHTVLQILYRALVASPGMAYVIPLLLWGALCAQLRFPKTEQSVRNPKSAPSPI
jgi:hypothetical protein